MRSLTKPTISLATLMDSLTTAVILLDDDLCITQANASAESLLETSARQLLGEPLAGYLEASSEFPLRLRDALNEQSSYAARELHLQLPQGRLVVVEATVSALSERRPGACLLVELIARDRHKSIVRGESMYSQQSVSQALVRGMAHEVKNPLGGIRGAAQLLERELEDPSLHEFTQIIIGESDRLQTLVDRMLGPTMPPVLQRVNVHESLERVSSLLQAETGLEIVRDYDPSIPPVNIDSGEFMQAVLNVARNASQALNDTPEPTITISSRVQRQYTIGSVRHKLVVRIDIADNGPGIDPNLVPNIFYPMVSGRADGTGLGLSIAQSMINRQQGLIECESQPGNTVFSIYLPLD